MGKTTLARIFVQDRNFTFFDLEAPSDQQRLQNPELVLGQLEGVVVIDEIQRAPELFNILRVLVDRPASATRFLILGSASPDIIRNASETLAGRVEFIELAGFDLDEVGGDHWQELWNRGGFPRSYLAASDADSVAWREDFIQTFLERDIPQLGITIPATAMRRFWTMLAHYHGQTWNASVLGRGLGISDKTVRSYLDILTGTYMVRQLQPWHVNISKRQVRSPKVYLRDAGLLHTLLNLTDLHDLFGHPGVGASWEGFVLEQSIDLLALKEVYFWGTHGGAELDLLFFHKGQSYGIEVKFSDAPSVTKSMRIAMKDLQLSHLYTIYPGKHIYPAEEKITMWPLKEFLALREIFA